MAAAGPLFDRTVLPAVDHPVRAALLVVDLLDLRGALRVVDLLDLLGALRVVVDRVARPAVDSVPPSGRPARYSPVAGPTR
jgi:hypothetical protein